MGNIYDPSGAYGATAGANSNIQIPFKASAAVTAKTLVAIDTENATVATQATDGADVRGIGIAMGTVAANETVMVTVYGYVKDVLVQGTIAASDILKVSGTTDGYLSATATPAQGEAVAFAVEASSGGAADVFVKCIQDT